MAVRAGNRTGVLRGTEFVTAIAKEAYRGYHYHKRERWGKELGIV